MVRVRGEDEVLRKIEELAAREVIATLNAAAVFGREKTQVALHPSNT